MQTSIVMTPENGPPDTTNHAESRASFRPLKWLLATVLTLLPLLILWWVPEPIPGVRPLELFGQRWYLRFPNGILATLVRGILLIRLLALGWELISEVLLPRLEKVIPTWMRGRTTAPRPEDAVGTTGESVPWENIQWSVEFRWMVIVLAFTVVARLYGAHYFNPMGFPMGSDSQTFVTNAWAVATRDWLSYNQDKYPLYPALSALMGYILGGNFAQGCLLVSWLSMTLSAPFLYISVSLPLGRATALIACLLFAVSSYFQYYANATTMYGIFTGCTLISTGLTVLALNRNSNLLYFLAGLSYAVGYSADVKFLTIATPLLLLCLYHRLTVSHKWRQPLLRWLFLLFPLFAVVASIQFASGFFTPLAHKFEFQRQEVARFFEQTRHIQVNPTEPMQGTLDIPPLAERIRFNLVALRVFSPRHWELFLSLFGIGCVFALLRRDGRSLRERLQLTRGVLVPITVISSMAGAISMLYLPKYGVHAIPYVMALIVAGGLTVLSWFLPRSSPQAFRLTMGLWFAAILALMGISGTDGLEAPRTYRTDDILAVYQHAAQNPELVTAAGAYQLGSWVQKALKPTDRLEVCAPAELAMAIPYEMMESGRREVRRTDCAYRVQQTPTHTRYWLVDASPHNPIYARLTSDPKRFQSVYSQSLLIASQPTTAQVFREETNTEVALP